MKSNSPKTKKRMAYRPLFTYINDKIQQSASAVKKLMPFSTKAHKLKEEVTMLTSYSSDTVYRLRYDSMTYDYVSPAVVRLLGFSPEEMQKINFRSLILETKIITDSMKSIHSFDDLEKARKNGLVDRWQADYLVRTKDGRKIWVTDLSSPWFDSDGKIIGSIGSLRDVTRRVEAEQRTKEDFARMESSDLLTGLANRKTFFEHVENELRRIKRSNSHFSVLLVDVDHFKKVNDNFGHATGDKILTQIAGIISGCLRDTDVAARIGGEEFGVFLPDTPEEGAYWVAERICLEISKHNFFSTDAIMPIRCTVSIGLSSTEGNRTIDAASLYKNADSRLYIAKHTGRNQVSRDEIVHYH